MRSILNQSVDFRKSLENSSLVNTKNKSSQKVAYGLQAIKEPVIEENKAFKSDEKSENKIFKVCHISENKAFDDAEKSKNKKTQQNGFSVALNKPRYVKACENEHWTLSLTNKKTGETWLTPYKCKSWRHSGPCSRAKGAQDFVRIKKAMVGLGENWIYMVLTFKQSISLFKSYKNIVRCWNKFRCRLVRKFGKFQYITLIEQHKSGYPHVNVLIYSEFLSSLAEGDGWQKLRKSWFDRHVQESGFGWKYWLEPVRSRDKISSYFVKLVGQMASEFTKPSQNPISAPKNFRRLRASEGLLEKIFKNEDITGELLFLPFDLLTKNSG
jgi:hypothetical protein